MCSLQCCLQGKKYHPERNINTLQRCCDEHREHRLEPTQRLTGAQRERRIPQRTTRVVSVALFDERWPAVWLRLVCFLDAHSHVVEAKQKKNSVSPFRNSF